MLAALGEPLSPEFDGRVLESAFADPPAVSTMAPSEVPEPRVRGASDDDQAARDDAVEDRLEDLGYLE
jgi:hypothetical protein